MIMLNSHFKRPLSSVKTLTLNPSPKLGEGLENQKQDRCNSLFLAPLRPFWEKGVGDEGVQFTRANSLIIADPKIAIFPNV